MTCAFVAFDLAEFCPFVGGCVNSGLRRPADLPTTTHRIVYTENGKRTDLDVEWEPAEVAHPRWAAARAAYLARIA